jgi:SAM-dependent methyltransferase
VQATEVVHSARTFDDQAQRYDGRVGLPAGVGAAVAQAIVDRAGAGVGDLVLELGAGTGEIGVHLDCLPIRYSGLDASPAMLALFRAKAAPASPSLVVADCDRTWPLPNGSATAVFASRVIHLLQPGHVAGETKRVCRPAGLLILGRVVRDRDSIVERLRRRRLELLAAAGMTAPQGEAGTRRVIEACTALGGVSLGRQIVAEWTIETTPSEILATWNALNRSGSVTLDDTRRESLQRDLRDWVQRHAGDPDQPETSPAHYAFDIVRMP